jgi:hypothetical protein
MKKLFVLLSCMMMGGCLLYEVPVAVEPVPEPPAVTVEVHRYYYWSPPAPRYPYRPHHHHHHNPHHR